MSGDVQPRKRKDKKRKKDDLGVEEPRGTAAVLGEGDVFMHSHHEHGTGGHWCAKIIFFSLLAVLITLVGLIILENRGLSELEAKAVESRYSGVLEGWLEDAPDDDHHDEHTLELTHHEHDDNTHDENTHLEDEDDEGIEYSDEEQSDDEEEDHEQYDEEENEQSNEDDAEQSDEDDAEQSDEDNDVLADENDDNENDDQENENSQEQDMQNDEDEEDNEEYHYKRQQVDSEEFEEIDDNDDDNSNEDDNHLENNEDDDDESNDQNGIEHESEEDHEYQEEKEDDDEHDEEDDGDDHVELERLEKETDDLLNEEPISTELPALLEDDDDTNENDKDEDVSTEAEQDANEAEDSEEDEYLELDDNEEPLVEHITAPSGKPLVEVEDDAASEQPPDTLAEEEEYEKRQAELRRDEEQSSHMWLKLTVGGALLVATHAVMRRATRDSQDEEDEIVREETPLTDRRMTLIADEPSRPVPVEKVVEEILQPKIEKKLETVFPTARPTIIKKQDSEEEEERQSEDEDIQGVSPTDNKELYSDEDEEEQVIVEAPKLLSKVTPPIEESKPAHESEPEDEDPDDVEIIDDEQLEEELEEEDEEEISDVDDAELLTRLEAKYGKLPEPERPGQKHKDGGNNIDDDWPGEPSDAYWRRQLDSAERELRQGEWNAAIAHAGADALRDSARARWIVARALDQSAEVQRDNRLLSRAISAYLNLLKMNERLSDKKLLQVTERTLDRIQFRGTYLNAEPVYRLLIRRFPNDPVYRNNLTISFLMANRADLAEDTLKETLKLWPNDRVALAHYGFVLKTSHNRYEDAVKAFEKALEGDTGPAIDARFYYYYGDALLLLGRPDEAHEVHKRAAALGHFLSPEQRSLYNVRRLKSRPWWNIEDTPYTRLSRALERSWKEILKEGEAAKALFEKEKEGLRERGEWSQMDLYVRGQEIPGRCKNAPVTCSVVKSEPAAVGCRRGQIKFSLMAPGTHVRPHVGPTNCRLRMHLGLSNTKDTYIRVDKEIRQWQTGKTFVFDDSFEHEVWHNGTGTRLVLIVDVWHPELTDSERRQLPAI